MSLFPNELGKLRFLPITILLMTMVGITGLAWYLWQDNELKELRSEVKSGNDASATKRAQRLEKVSLQTREVQRLRAISLGKSKPQEALRVILPLLDDPEEDDYILQSTTYLQIAIENQLLDEAESALETLHPNLNHVPNYLYWRAMYYNARGDDQEANRVINRLISIENDHYQARLLLAEIYLAQSSLTDWVSAKVNLRIAANDRGDTAKDALMLMATRPEIPMFENDRAWLAVQLRRFELESPEFGLLAFSQELAYKSDQREALIQQAIKKFGRSNPNLTANWLLSIRDYSQLYTFLQSPAGKQITANDRQKLILESAMIQSDFAQVQKILEEQELTSISEELQLTLLALAEDQQSQIMPDEPTPKWTLAQAAALESSEISTLLILAQIAARSGWWDQASETYAATVQTATAPEVRAEILSEKITVELKKQDTQQALRDIQQVLNIYPEHGVMLNNAYYLDALLDSNLFGEMQYPTEQLSNQLDGFIWSTYALAMWRAGKHELAQEAIDKLPQKYHELPSCQLVKILVAVQNQDIETARNLLDLIPVDGLLPEEAALLKQARQQIQS